MNDARPARFPKMMRRLSEGILGSCVAPRPPTRSGPFAFFSRGKPETRAQELYAAVIEYDTDACRNCLKEGADPLQKIKIENSVGSETIFSDITPLQAAVSHDNATALRLMLESFEKRHGVPLNLKTVDLRISGVSLLHTAVRDNFTDIVGTLVKAGADVFEEHPRLGSVCKIALTRKNLDAMTLLENALKGSESPRKQRAELEELKAEIKRMNAEAAAAAPDLPKVLEQKKKTETETTEKLLRRIEELEAREQGRDKKIEELEARNKERKKREEELESRDKEKVKKISKLEHQVKALKSQYADSENQPRKVSLKALATDSNNAYQFLVNTMVVYNQHGDPVSERRE
eukprot:m.41231 g.41231  ORF g.41231 m.41231 type:complete len:347 (+) comp33117_c0_seq2:308-1348(+)